jgi:positive regulator of sigma E activity
MAVACVALCIRLFYVIDRQVMLAQWGITQGQLVFLAVISVIWAWLSFRRYRRFGEYRTTHALLGFLTVKEQKKEGGADEKKGA